MLLIRFSTSRSSANDKESEESRHPSAKTALHHEIGPDFRTWIPWLAHAPRRKTFWVFTKHTQLRHIGDVTLILSKKRPKRTKLLVTNLTNVNARTVVAIYAGRWAVELLFKELKFDLGLGQHQVTKQVSRVEKSIGMAILAYLFLLRARREDIRPGKPWSIQQLQLRNGDPATCAS